MHGFSAVEEWVNFYATFFPNRAATEAWVSRCEVLAPPNNHAKIMMHQAQRLISISDEIPAIRRHTESLQLMFLITCAENISKLHDKYTGDGRSREYVRRFFQLFVVGDDRRTIERAFIDDTDHNLRLLPFDRAVDILYDVRCDVVHEGNYWGFSFHDGSTPMLNVAPNVTANIRFSDLRNTVVGGCINAVTDRLNAP